MWTAEIDRLSRRRFLGTVAVACGATGSVLADENSPASSHPNPEPPDTYETQAKGIRILPGAWRPHYPWEHIAWISPSWPSQDYIWADFPEAIFTDQGLLFLSHLNPGSHIFPNLPAVPWQQVDNGIAFQRELPNGVVFGSTITRADRAVDLELFIRNGSKEPLTGIRLQICFFLRAIREFAAYGWTGQFLHVAEHGWVNYDPARRLESKQGRYRLEANGPLLADRPIMVTRSSKAPRLIAVTFYDQTASVFSNPNHPCMHADPVMAEILPGQTGNFRGKLIFFEGTLDAFDRALQKGLLSKRPRDGGAKR